MKEKSYYFKSNSIRLILALGRILHLFVFLIIASFITYGIISFLDSWLTDENLEFPEKIFKVLGYGTISTFAVLALKNVLSGKADELISYLLTDDIQENNVSTANWTFNSRVERRKELNRFMNTNIKQRYAFRIAVYFIIIFLAGWLAYITFKDPASAFNHDKPNNYYFMSYPNSKSSWQGNPGDFKLIFSFGHRRTDIKEFSLDESETLTNLLRALKGCLQSPKDTVKLKIIGFASEYQNDQGKKNEDINLANNRALVIEDQINKFKDDYLGLLPHLSRIKVIPHVWKLDEYENMVKARIFQEVKLKDATEKEQQNETSEYLNRRAEVIIIHAGSCE